MSDKQLQTAETRLERVEPAHDTFRFYHAGLWPDLFGGVSLVREWGRIGQAGTLRGHHYADPTEARAALERLVARKRRRGYTEIGP